MESMMRFEEYVELRMLWMGMKIFERERKERRKRNGPHRLGNLTFSYQQPSHRPPHPPRPPPPHDPILVSKNESEQKKHTETSHGYKTDKKWNLNPRTSYNISYSTDQVSAKHTKQLAQPSSTLHQEFDNQKCHHADPKSKNNSHKVRRAFNNFVPAIMKSSKETGTTKVNGNPSSSRRELLLSKKHNKSKAYLVKDNFIRYNNFRRSFKGSFKERSLKEPLNITGTKIVLNADRTQTQLQSVDLRALEGTVIENCQGDNIENDANLKPTSDENGERRSDAIERSSNGSNETLRKHGNITYTVAKAMNNAQRMSHPSFNSRNVVSRFNLNVETDLKQSRKSPNIETRKPIVGGIYLGTRDDGIRRVRRRPTNKYGDESGSKCNQGSNVMCSTEKSNSTLQSDHLQYGSESTKILTNSIHSCLNVQTNSLAPPFSGTGDNADINVDSHLQQGDGSTTSNTTTAHKECEEVIKLGMNNIVDCCFEEVASTVDDGYGSESNRSHMSGQSDTSIMNMHASDGASFGTIATKDVCETDLVEDKCKIDDISLHANYTVNNSTEPAHVVPIIQNSFTSLKDLDFSSIDLNADMKKFSSAPLFDGDIASDSDIYQDDKFRRRKSIHAELENILKGQVQKLNDKSATLPVKPLKIELKNTSSLPTKSPVSPDKGHTKVPFAIDNRNGLYPTNNNLSASFSNLSNLRNNVDSSKKVDGQSLSRPISARSQDAEKRNSLLTELRNTINKDVDKPSIKADTIKNNSMLIHDSSRMNGNEEFKSEQIETDQQFIAPGHSYETYNGVKDYSDTGVSELHTSEYSEPSNPQNMKLHDETDMLDIETIQLDKNFEENENFILTSRNNVHYETLKDNDIVYPMEGNIESSSPDVNNRSYSPMTYPTTPRPAELAYDVDSATEVRGEGMHDERPINKEDVMIMLTNHFKDKNGAGSLDTDGSISKSETINHSPRSPRIIKMENTIQVHHENLKDENVVDSNSVRVVKPHSPGIGNLKAMNFSFPDTSVHSKYVIEEKYSTLPAQSRSNHFQVYGSGTNHNGQNSKSPKHTPKRKNHAPSVPSISDKEFRTELETTTTTDIELTKSELDYIRGDSTHGHVTQVSENTYTFTLEDLKTDVSSSNGNGSTISMKVVDCPSSQSSRRTSNVSAAEMSPEHRTSSSTEHTPRNNRSRKSSINSTVNQRTDDQRGPYRSRSSSIVSLGPPDKLKSSSNSNIFVSEVNSYAGKPRRCSSISNLSSNNSNNNNNHERAESNDTRFYPDNLDHLPNNKAKKITRNARLYRDDSLSTRSTYAGYSDGSKRSFSLPREKKFCHVETQTDYTILDIFIRKHKPASTSPPLKPANPKVSDENTDGTKEHENISATVGVNEFNGSARQKSVENTVFELTDSEIEYVQEETNRSLLYRSSTVPDLYTKDTQDVKQDIMKETTLVTGSSKSKPTPSNKEKSVHIPPPDYDDVPLPDFTKVFCPPEENEMIETNKSEHSDEKYVAQLSQSVPCTPSERHLNITNDFATSLERHLEETKHSLRRNVHDPKNSWLYKKQVGKIDIPEHFQKNDTFSRKTKKKTRSLEDSKESGRQTPTLLRSPMSSISKAIGKSFKMLLSPKNKLRNAQSVDCLDRSQKMNDIITRRKQMNSSIPWGFDTSTMSSAGGSKSSRKSNDNNNHVCDSDDIDFAFISNNEWLKRKETDQINYSTEDNNGKIKPPRPEPPSSKKQPVLKQPLLLSTSGREKYIPGGRGIGPISLPHVFSEEKSNMLGRRFLGRQKTFDVQSVMKTENTDAMLKLAREAAFNSFDINKEQLHFRSLP